MLLAPSLQAAPSLSSVAVDLPVGDRTFPQGPGSDLTNANCLLCHSIDMVLYQPPLSRAGWEAEVKKMRNVYKAPIDPTDDAALVDYLMSIKGIK